MVVATLKHFFAKSGPGATGINLSGRDVNASSGGTAGVPDDGDA